MSRKMAWSLSFAMVLGVACHRPAAVPASVAKVEAGGGCTYVDVPGEVEITRVTWEGGKAEVRFTFHPDKPSPQQGTYQSGQDRDQPLEAGGGVIMTREWLGAKGIRPGARIRAVRRERTRGTCTPVVYAFPSIPEAF